MSIWSIIISAGTRCDIKRQTSTVGDGAQLTKTWSLRYANVPCRMKVEKDKTFFYIEYKSDVARSDRIIFKTRTFGILSVIDWEENKKYLKIEVKEER